MHCWPRLLLFFLGLLAAAQPAFAQFCCEPSYRVMCQTVYDQQQVTAYRLEYRTEYEDRQVTTYRPVWETEMRERRYRVATPIVETSEREERYTVMEPVWDTEVRDNSYDRVRYVQKTEMREQRYVVQRPVWDTVEQERQYTVRQPVVDTVMQDRTYTKYEPVTTMRTQYVDQGQFVDQTQTTPGATRSRLQWLSRQYYTDPATGIARWQRAGFYWVPIQGRGTVQTQRVWVGNVVAQQVPQVSYQPQTVVEKVPVQVTRYEDRVVTRKVPVQVYRVEQHEEVRQVPHVSYDRVVERVEQQQEVRVCRYQPREVVRKIPVTTHRVEYEERVEQQAVKVCKMVAVEQSVRVPRRVSYWAPVTYTRLMPRTVVMRVPLDGAGTAYYRGEPAADCASTDDNTTTLQKVPTPELAPQNEAPVDGTSSSVDDDVAAQQDGEPEMPVEADVDPSLDPQGLDLLLNPPTQSDSIQPLIPNPDGSDLDLGDPDEA